MLENQILVGLENILAYTIFTTTWTKTFS